MIGLVNLVETSIYVPQPEELGLVLDFLCLQGYTEELIPVNMGTMVGRDKVLAHPRTRGPRTRGPSPPDMDSKTPCHFKIPPTFTKGSADSGPTVLEGLAMWPCVHYR